VTNGKMDEGNADKRPSDLSQYREGYGREARARPREGLYRRSAAETSSRLKLSEDLLCIEAKPGTT
jgi:hypothetical protein